MHAYKRVGRLYKRVVGFAIAIVTKQRKVTLQSICHGIVPIKTNFGLGFGSVVWFSSSFCLFCIRMKLDKQTRKRVTCLCFVYASSVIRLLPKIQIASTMTIGMTRSFCKTNTTKKRNKAENEKTET
jgi:hypothetical protein